MAVATKRILFLSAVFLAFLLLAGLLTGLLLKAVHQPQRDRIRFADGTQVRLLGVTRGKQTFTTEKPWQKTARRLVPRQWLSWLPDSMSSSVGGDSNSLGIWFKISDPTGANVYAPWQWYAAVSDNGFRYPISSGSGSTSNGRTIIQQIYLQAFPHRQTEFDLQFYDANMRLLGSLRVANPIRGPFPSWKPEQMPITRTNGPLVVTLESITEHSNKFSPYNEWLSVKWKLKSTDPLWRVAKPGYEEWLDATGNHGQFLAYEEPAWKLQLPFRRPDPTNYLATEKFTLTSVVVPAPGTFQLLTNEYHRMGVQFRIRGLVGVGTLAITNGTNFAMISSSPGAGAAWSSTSDGRVTVDTLRSAKRFFLIEESGLDPLDELRFRVILPDGRDRKVEGIGTYYTGNGQRYYKAAFDVTDEMSNVSLETIVSRARLVEFIVNPAEVHRP